MAEALKLNIEKAEKPLNITIGLNSKKTIERKISKFTLELPGFKAYERNCFVMPIPEGKDIMLGMPWFVTQNPDIDWKKGTIKPRSSTEDNIYRYHQILRREKARKLSGGHRIVQRHHLYRLHEVYQPAGYVSQLSGCTKVVPVNKLKKILKQEDTEFCFQVQVHETKKDRYENQDWKKLKDNPAYEILLEYKDSVFKSKLPTVSTKDQQSRGQHEITLKDTNPINVKNFRVSKEQQTAIEEWVKEMLDAGIIQPSQSPYSAPTFCVKKPVGWRIVHDYRKLNERTIVPQIPTPRKDEVIDRMANCKVFSTFDLTSGYFQLALRQSDRQYTAFSCGHEHYEYVVTPMGLSGAPGSFNRFIQKIFIKYREFCSTYFDDIYLYTTTMEKHLQKLRQILEICKTHQLYLKLEKSVVAQSEIPCLGDFVGVDGVRMDPEKARIIKEWPEPKTKRQMKQFLGTVVYNQRFCKDFGHMVAPLHECTKGKQKNEPIVLSKTQLEAFEKLKDTISRAPVLRIADSEKKFLVRTDASNFAVGGVLMQQDEDDRWQPVAYTGKKFSSAELNYPVREQELLAIIHALKVWRFYLIDKEFIVETDHQSLQLLLSEKKASRRLIRWLDILAEFPIKIRYIPGETNSMADGLSRCVKFEDSIPASEVSFRDYLKQLLDSLESSETAVFNHQELMIKHYVQLESLASIIEDCKKLYSTDTKLTAVIASLTRAPVEEGKDSSVTRDYYLENNLLWKKINDESFIVVPENQDLRDRIIFNAHDRVDKGHPGIARTVKSIQKEFWWKNMTKSVTLYIQECQICQRVKSRQSKPPGLLKQHKVPCGRWEEVSMDFITNLPVTVGGKYTSIWTIICRLTKRLMMIPVQDTTNSRELIYTWNNQYVPSHGFPKTIICDRDSRFTAQVWQALMQAQDTKLKMSVGYRSETAGQAERSHRFIEDYFRCYLSRAHNIWDEFLGTGEYAFNAAYSTTIDMSPFEADIGYIPPMEYVTSTTDNIDHKTFLYYQLNRLEWAKEQMLISQERAKKFYNHNRPIQDFKIRDLVLVATDDLAMKHLGTSDNSKRKFGPRWIGPFPVVEQLSSDTYRLDMGKVKLHTSYHTSKLKPYYQKKNTVDQPIEVCLEDGEQGFIVEKIIGKRMRKKKLQYQVKWLGTSETTWEPVENLQQVLGLVEEFEIKQDMAKRPRLSNQSLL